MTMPEQGKYYSVNEAYRDGFRPAMVKILIALEVVLGATILPDTSGP